MSISIPENHPRYLSLTTRHTIIEDCEKKIVAPAGLIAHGRGEAYDYLIGEETQFFAEKAVTAAAAAILLAVKPIISINGNIASLCADELVELSDISGALMEINLFYRSIERENAILKKMRDAGAVKILGTGASASARIPEIGSERRRVDPNGIMSADLVMVPLEDGDRTEALVKMGKKVITIDLNPLSRTAQMSSISIVDNVIRTVPLLIKEIKLLKKRDKSKLVEILEQYNNKNILKKSLAFIAKRLTEKR